MRELGERRGDVGSLDTIASSTTGNVASRKRYLIVINEIGFVYSHFWSLAQAIQNAGWELWIAAARAADPQRALDAGMRFAAIRPTLGIGRPFNEFSSILELRRTIQSIKPDVLHLVSLKNVLLGGIIARAEKTPAVLGAITGLGTLFVEDRALYRAIRPIVTEGLRFVFAHGNTIMALENPDDEKFFLDRRVVRHGQTCIIPGSGLDKNVIVPQLRNSRSPIILCVSRMIRNKGILDLVGAAKILYAQGLKFELQLVGDVDLGNPTSLTSEELQSLDCDEFVKWLGRRSDIPELLSAASIFCLPSYYREGLPRSLVEASAAGLPIVTTDTAGCRQVVVDGETGYLVSPQDVPELAQALAKLLRSRELRDRMGAAGRRRFEEEFTTKSVLNAFTNCYAKLNIPLDLDA